MPERNDSAARLPTRRGCFAACALLLASCAPLPALTLHASSSWRTRRDAAAKTHAWNAGAQLGWSARAKSSAAEHAARERDPGALGTTAVGIGDVAPCAFETTCRWEHAASSAALGRAHDLFAGDDS